MNVVILIPAHNESLYISEVVKKCLKYSPSVLVIDDGSTDNTTQVATISGAAVYRYAKNQGVGEALKVGFYMTQKADIVVTLDGDNQHNPDDIPKLIEAIKDGNDIAIGSRFLNKIEIPPYRRFGNWLITLAFNLGHKPITDSQSGFRAFSRKAIDHIQLIEKGFGTAAEMIIKARKQGYKIVEVPVSCTYHNLEQDSHMNPFGHGMEVILKTIYWRLREWN